MINLSEVTIDYHEVIPENKQMAEFYATGNWEPYATLTRGDRVISFGVNGEMHLTIPYVENNELIDGYNIIRDCWDMSEHFKDDIQFNQFLKTMSNSGFEVYRMNPWWEFFADEDPDGIVPTSSNFYGAIEEAIEVLFDDEYWAAIRADS